MTADSERTEQRQCPTHGSYTAKVLEIAGRPITQGCPACAAAEAERKTAAAQRVQAEAAQRRVEMLRKASGIPPRFADRTLQGYRAETAEQQKALRVATAYVEQWPQMRDRGASLIFSGRPGTGKTHLACAIASAVIDTGHSALFTTVLDAMRSIKRSYDRDAGISETDAVMELVKPSLLVLDEVGADLGTDHSKVLLFDLMNKRYEHMRPTIILTNLDAAALREYCGDRIMDRLREGGGRLVTFTWDSHRSTI